MKHFCMVVDLTSLQANATHRIVVKTLMDFVTSVAEVAVPILANTVYSSEIMIIPRSSSCSLEVVLAGSYVGKLFLQLSGG